MRLLAQIGMKLDVLDDAEFLLESVLAFAPDYHAARYDYAEVLSRAAQAPQALEQMSQAAAVEPRNRAFRALEANALRRSRRHDEALRDLSELLPETPRERRACICRSRTR